MIGSELCWNPDLACRPPDGKLYFEGTTPLQDAASKLDLLKATKGLVDAGTESSVFTRGTDYIHSHPLEGRSADLLIIDFRVVTRWLVLFFSLEPFDLVRQVKNGTDQRQHSLIIAARF
jgi:hypothetical protein